MGFIDEDSGNVFPFVVVLVGIAVAGFFWLIIDEGVSQIDDEFNESGVSAATLETHNWLHGIWDKVLVFVLFCMVLWAFQRSQKGEVE